MISRSVYPDRRAGMLLAATTLLLFAAVGGAVVLPTSDATLRETSPQRRSLDESERRGMDIYRSEGCWYCHTQQVREVSTDTGLGAPLRAGDYPSDGPSLLGAERIGPDLTHVGSRHESAEALVRAMRVRRHPGYGFLSRREMDDLAAYLLALR